VRVYTRKTKAVLKDIKKGLIRHTKDNARSRQKALYLLGFLY